MVDEVSHPLDGMPIPVDDDALGASEQDSIGRCKGPPVCGSSELKNKSMTTSQLLELAYESQNIKSTTIMVDSGCIAEVNLATVLSAEDATANSPSSHSHVLNLIPRTVSVSASASSCGASTGSLSRDCDVVTLSDCETKSGCHTHAIQESEKLNARIVQRKTSRQGRAWQRWDPADNNVGEPVRLVVGTVPILKGGKILFVSASRKPEWILPKGGWEGDETMEESAVRESYEEAGVVGVLGKALTAVKHETRKSKKRRLEMEELLHGGSGKVQDTPGKLFEDGAVEETTQPLSDEKSESNFATLEGKLLSSEELSKIQNQYQYSLKATDETMSVGSSFSATYSFVKMTLFPLYVTDVLGYWPESGRFRTAVDIHTAIAMMDARPEFKAVLLEIKARGLHLVECPFVKPND
jgi:ADP-ribose pyrophosphatase YjhB (NUDIX family)